MADYALSFDGEDDYVESTVVDSDTFTVIVIAKISSTQNNNYPYLIATTLYEPIADADGFRLMYNSLAGTISFQIANGTSSLSISADVKEDTYAMYAMSYDGSTLNAYVNLNKYTASGSLSGIGEGRPLVIGASANKASASRTNADITIVLYYNRALSDSEIQAIYNDPLNPPTDGLMLWLAPDSVDTANDIWTDKSGNNNDGTIYGCLYIPTRWTTKDGVLTIEEIWELNTVRFNYPWPASIKNKINRVVEVMPTLNNTYVVFDKALGGEEVTFTFYLDPDYDDDEKIRSEILLSGIVKIRTPDLRYYGDYVVKSIDWDIDAFNKHILKITAVRV